MAAPKKKPARKNPAAKALKGGQFKQRVVPDKKKRPPKASPKWQQGPGE